MRHPLNRSETSTVSSDEKAIRAVNNSVYGLAVGVFSTDVSRALSVAQLEVGQAHSNFPFGTGTNKVSKTESPTSLKLELTYTATLSVGISKSSG